MKLINITISVLSFVLCVMSSLAVFSQQGKVEINQDNRIDTLLELKKQMNSSDIDFERYKVQIYSGDRVGAQHAQNEFNGSFSNWGASMQYEAPNFKIWVGNFRTKLEADRSLELIKKKFPSAVVFKPKK